MQNFLECFCFGFLDRALTRATGPHHHPDVSAGSAVLATSLPDEAGR
jgi:hypothetical protein